MRTGIAKALVLLAACGNAAPVLEDAEVRRIDSGASLGILLVDSAITPAVAGEGGWNYLQTAIADLNGDGASERVVLTARVEMRRGRPAWDDGQPWQVYIESRGGRRSYIYAQRLQLGTLTMRIGADSGSTVVLLEQLPDRLSVYEARYRGPDSVAVYVGFQRGLLGTAQAGSTSFPP